MPDPSWCDGKEHVESCLSRSTSLLAVLISLNNEPTECFSGQKKGSSFVPSRAMRKVLVSLVLFAASWADAACFEEAAKRYSVPIELLVAISKVESGGNPRAYNKNANGSHDIGHMQINSAWLPTLARYGIDEEKLQDPCINTNIGAWVLAQNVARFGLTWNAVGAYNAATESKRLKYARKVQRVLLEKPKT